MGLTVDQMQKLAEIVKEQIIAKGTDFFSWINPPIMDHGQITHQSSRDALRKIISPERAMTIYKQKLDGVYGERLALSICTAIGAAKAGRDVALLQFQAEPHAPFDANGWLVLAVDFHPMFHIAPSDLSFQRVQEAGLVTFVATGSPEAQRFVWKGTTKADELCLLLDSL